MYLMHRIEFAQTRPRVDLMPVFANGVVGERMCRITKGHKEMWFNSLLRVTSVAARPFVIRRDPTPSGPHTFLSGVHWRCVGLETMALDSLGEMFFRHQILLLRHHLDIAIEADDSTLWSSNHREF